MYFDEAVKGLEAQLKDLGESTEVYLYGISCDRRR